jgi:hypothetical protein
VGPAMQAHRSPAMVGGGGAGAVGPPSPATVPVRRRCEGTAMGAITLDLRPGNGVGPFTLGELLLPPNPNHPPSATVGIAVVVGCLLVSSRFATDMYMLVLEAIAGLPFCGW